jgi:Rod binding domain-containing protein
MDLTPTSATIQGAARPDSLASLTQSTAHEALRSARAGETKQAAVAFESLLGAMLVRELRRALPAGFFGRGAGADTYEAWLDDQVGRTLGERDAFGMRTMLEREIGRIAERRAAEETNSTEELLPEGATEATR